MVFSLFIMLVPVTHILANLNSEFAEHVHMRNKKVEFPKDLSKT